MAVNVLVLNDEENSLGSLIEALQAGGYTAYSTTSADDCIDKFEEISPKALYFSLKTIGVLDSLQVIRMDPDGATVPIFFHGTGKEGIKNEKTAKDRGGDFFYKFDVNVGEVVHQTKKSIGPGDPNAPLPDEGGGAEPEPEPVAEEPPAEEPAASPEETLVEASEALLEEIEAAEAPAEAAPEMSAAEASLLAAQAAKAAQEAEAEEAPAEAAPEMSAAEASLLAAQAAKAAQEAEAEEAPAEAAPEMSAAEASLLAAQAAKAAQEAEAEEAPAEAAPEMSAAEASLLAAQAAKAAQEAEAEEAPAEAAPEMSAAEASLLAAQAAKAAQEAEAEEAPAEAAPEMSAAEASLLAAQAAKAAQEAEAEEAPAAPAADAGAVAQAQEMAQAAEAARQALQDELDALKAELESSKVRNSELEDKLGQAEDQRTKLEQTKDEETAKLTNDLNEVKERARKQASKLVELEEKLENAAAAHEKNIHEAAQEEAAKRDELVDAMKKRDEEFAELSEKLREVQDTLASEKGQRSEEEGVRRALEDDKRRADEREKRLNEDFARMERERERLEGERDKLEAELKAQIDENRSRLEQELDRREREQDRWEESIAEKSQLEEQIREQEQTALERENEEATRRIEEEQNRRKVEDEIRRQTEQNVRTQLKQEERYREHTYGRQDDPRDVAFAQSVKETMTEQFGPAPHPASPNASRPQSLSPSAQAPHSRLPQAPVTMSPSEPNRHEPLATAQHHPANAADFDPMEGLIDGPNDIAMLFANLWYRQTSGRVDFNQGQVHKVIFFERGTPVDAYSNQVADRIEDFLYRDGKITRSQYQSLRLRNIQGSRKVGAALVGEGHLKPEELFESVRGHLRDVVLSLFEWEVGSFRYRNEFADDETRVRLKLDARGLIVEGIRRKFLLPRLMTIVGPPSTLLQPRGDTRLDLEAMQLDGRERQAVRMLDGTRSIEDIVFSTGLAPVQVYHIMTAMLTLGFAHVAVRGSEGFRLDGTSAADTVDRRRIEDKVEQTRHQNYFAILGLTPHATPYEIQRAYRRIQQEFSAGNFSEKIRSQHGRELHEIERVVEDAWEVLRDDSLRMAYARNLPGHTTSLH